MNEIIESTQQIVSVHNKTLIDWVQGYNDLIKHQHTQQGYYFMLAKKALGGTWAEFSKEIGMTEQSIGKKIKLYKDIKELEQVAPEKELPTEIGKHQALKGLTPENKADNYQMVKDRTETINPTVKQIKEVMKTVEAPVTVVAPVKKNLRNDNQLSNLNPILSWHNNYSGPTVEALTEADKNRIQEIEDQLHALYEEAVSIFPFYHPEL